MLSSATKAFNILLFLCMVSPALAQFNFFEQMFGQGPPGGQHQQRRPPSHSQWAAQADAGMLLETAPVYPQTYTRATQFLVLSICAQTPLSACPIRRNVRARTLRTSNASFQTEKTSGPLLQHVYAARSTAPEWNAFTNGSLNEGGARRRPTIPLLPVRKSRLSETTLKTLNASADRPFNRSCGAHVTGVDEIQFLSSSHGCRKGSRKDQTSTGKATLSSPSQSTHSFLSRHCLVANTS